jgi:uncharacterized membrane protein
VLLVPFALTIWILTVVFLALDRLISPLLGRFGVDVPGLGFATMVGLILIIGLLSRNLLGRILFGTVDALMRRIPVVKSLYTASKEIISAFASGGGSKSFRRVVLVEYPRNGLYAVGFVTNDLEVERAAGDPRAVVSVYFPHPPNPTSGVMVMVPAADVQVLEMTVEEGLKLALSGGIVAPPLLRQKGKAPSPHPPTSP